MYSLLSRWINLDFQESVNIIVFMMKLALVSQKYQK